MRSGLLLSLLLLAVRIESQEWQDVSLNQRWERDGSSQGIFLRNEEIVIACSPQATAAYTFIKTNSRTPVQIQVSASLSQPDRTVPQGVVSAIREESWQSSKILPVEWSKTKHNQVLGHLAIPSELGRRATKVVIAIGCGADIRVGEVRIKKVSILWHDSFLSELPTGKQHLAIASDQEHVCNTQSEEAYVWGERGTELKWWLVTHASMDRAQEALNLIRKWSELFHQPVAASVSIWLDIPATEEGAATASLRKTFSQFLQAVPNVKVVLTLSTSGGEKAYPINRMRNIAWRAARRGARLGFSYFLIVDADVLPFGDFELGVSQLITNDSIVSRDVFVLATFDAPRPICTSLDRKDSLRRYFRSGKARIFKDKHQPLAYGPVQFERWFVADTTYTVDYVPQFEPYMLVPHESSTNEMEFDERFTGFGWNKASFVGELYLRRFRFVVLPNVWLIHCTHAKSSVSQLFSHDLAFRAMNRIARHSWFEDLIARYGSDAELFLKIFSIRNVEES